MKRLPALAAGGADEDDVSGGESDSRLLFHLCDSVFDQTEYRVEVDRNRGAPLLIGHLVDGDILLGPNAVIGDKDVDSSDDS